MASSSRFTSLSLGYNPDSTLALGIRKKSDGLPLAFCPLVKCIIARPDPMTFMGKKHFLARVAAAHHVIDRTGKFQS